jgi:geranylgeranyl diphosphate synthase type I
MSEAAFFEFLKETDKLVKDYYSNSPITRHFRPDHIHQGVMSYLMRSAKRLRPAIMRMCCGCYAPDKVDAILPAAAAVELFHTWTLVHDDIIDNDDKRRGAATTHILLAESGKEDLHLKAAAAAEYGKSAAILAGDVQHGWVNAAFLETADDDRFDPIVVIRLLQHFETEVLGNLIYGELRDVQLGLLPFAGPVKFDEADVIEMEIMKTAELLQFAARAGVMLAKNTTDFNDPDVKAVSKFAGSCGLAFQIQDDILGIIGKESKLGKPIGSDIREGKKTIIVLHAFKQANEGQRAKLLSTLGNRKATEAEINEATELLHQLGGIDYARGLAQQNIENAYQSLDRVPDSKYKQLLTEWANFMVNREI